MTSHDYNDPIIANALPTLHKIQPHFKINTFDVVNYTKPTDDKIEEPNFPFRLMTRQNISPIDLDELNNELEVRMQERT